MAPKIGKPSTSNTTSATADRPSDETRRDEVTIRRLFRSPLAVRVALAVFVSIMVVEAIILFPSYRRQEERLLEDLRRVGTQWLLAAEPSYAHSGDPGVYAAIVLRAPLVVGVTVFGTNDLVVATSGEELEVTVAAADQANWGIRTADGQRFETMWSGEESPIGLTVALRMDGSGVAADLQAFVLRILGLIVIVSAALTGATMVAMGTVVLRPLVALSNALAKGGDGDWHGRNVIYARRNDEIGDVFRATTKLLEQLGRARRDLEARVEARTAEIQEVNA